MRRDVSNTFPCRGNCKKGDYCNYEHQADGDGKPIPVGPEALQKYDEAVKRFQEIGSMQRPNPRQEEEYLAGLSCFFVFFFLLFAMLKRISKWALNLCMNVSTNMYML